MLPSNAVPLILPYEEGREERDNLSFTDRQEKGEAEPHALALSQVLSVGNGAFISVSLWGLCTLKPEQCLLSINRQQGASHRHYPCHPSYPLTTVPCHILPAWGDILLWVRCHSDRVSSTSFRGHPGTHLPPDNCIPARRGDSCVCDSALECVTAGKVASVYAGGREFTEQQRSRPEFTALAALWPANLKVGAKPPPSMEKETAPALLWRLRYLGVCLNDYY